MVTDFNVVNWATCEIKILVPKTRYTVYKDIWRSTVGAEHLICERETLYLTDRYIGMSLFCFYFHLFFFLAILLFLDYYAQYFAQSWIFCSKFSYIASYLTVISYTYIPKLYTHIYTHIHIYTYIPKCNPTFLKANFKLYKFMVFNLY